MLQSVLQISGSTQLSMLARTYNSERGIGSQVDGPLSTSIARQKDNDHLVQLQLNGSSQLPLPYHLGIQVHNAYVRYQDFAFTVAASSLDNYYRNVDWRIEPGVQFSFGDQSRVAIGGDFSSIHAEGNSLASAVHRKTYGAYTSVEHKLVGEANFISGLYAYPSFRFDGITTEGKTVSQWSPQVGLALSFNELGNLAARPTLRASISRNFSAPTFNQLYFAGGGGIGNPNLRPERSTSADVGGDIAINFFGTHLVRASVFSIAMSDRIQWVAAGAFTVKPKNIRNVRSRGVELSYQFHTLDDVVSFDANYSSMSTTKVSEDFPGDPNISTQLIYVPQETAHFSLTLSQSFDDTPFKQLAATMNHSFVGLRYTTEDNKNILPSYILTSMNIRTKFSVAMLLCNARFEVNNLFNTEYQTIVSYPMPGRSFKMTLGVEY